MNPEEKSLSIVECKKERTVSRRHTEKGVHAADSFLPFTQIKRARDGIRTRGPHLGKVVLHP